MAQVLNQIFHTKDQKVFLWVTAEKVENKGCFVTNIDGKVKAFEDGKEIKVPEVLYNEVETAYYYVADLPKFAERMAKKHGVYKATKQAPIRVYHVTSTEDIKSIINGVQEAAGLVVDENSVLAQNVIGGEFYVQQKSYLAENYKFNRHEGIYDVYDFAGEVQEWTFCDVNIFAALWGGIQFLATPMLRIDNPKDVYGCNYIRFWGDDQKAGTHRILAFFRACGKQFFATPFSMPVGVREATFEPPKMLQEQYEVA